MNHSTPLTSPANLNKIPTRMSPDSSCRSYDVAIIGAGIFGTAMASAFGKQGRKVLLLERDLSEPDRIVGELLQPGGVQALEKLGLRGMDCETVGLFVR